jgi:hypothetical protein
MLNSTRATTKAQKYRSGPYPNVGRALAAFGAEHQQRLIAGVGQRVAGLGQQAGGSGDEEADELGDGDAEVGEECGDDRFAAAVVHRYRLAHPPGSGVAASLIG